MSSTVVFWFGWFWKALISMPEFLGNNKTGVVYAALVALAFEFKAIRSLQGFRKAPNLRTRVRILGAHMVRHWRTSIALWVLIFVAFLVGHTFDMVRENADNLSTDKAKLEFSNKSLDSLCLADKSKLLVEGASQKSRADTLEKQNRDQQTLIAGCQEDAIKRITPALPKITALLFSDTPEASGQISLASYVILTNVSIAPTLLRVDCNQDLPVPYVYGAEILGANSGNGGSGNTQQVNARTLFVRLDTPTWTAISPIKLRIRHNSVNPLACNFTRM